MGGNMIRQIRPEFFAVLPHIVEWIKSKKELTDIELKAFIKINPALCEYLSNTPLEEIFEVSSYQLNHKIYGKHFEIVLSQEGRKWIEEHIKRIRESI